MQVPSVYEQLKSQQNVPSHGTNLFLLACFVRLPLRWNVSMSTRIGSPSIIPQGDNQTVYIVLDDFVANGRAYLRTDANRADLEAVVGMLKGQFNNPLRVVGFNTADGWSLDASADVVQEIRLRCDLQGRDVPFYLENFVEQYEGRYNDVQLPLPMRI